MLRGDEAVRPSINEKQYSNTNCAIPKRKAKLFIAQRFHACHSCRYHDVTQSCASQPDYAIKAYRTLKKPSEMYRNVAFRGGAKFWPSKSKCSKFPKNAVVFSMLISTGICTVD
jgi:hypothetical protein